MGKDGAGGDGGSTSSVTYQAQKNTFDLHIATLQIIDRQLERLHNALSVSDGDTDVTQEQITQLQEELVRLSQQLGDAEVELCTTSGNS